MENQMIEFNVDGILKSIDLDIPEEELKEEIFNLFFDGVDCINTMIKNQLTIGELVKMFLIIFNKTDKKYIYFNKRRLFTSTEKLYIEDAEFNVISDEENDEEIGALVSANYLEMVFTMQFIDLLCSIKEED